MENPKEFTGFFGGKEEVLKDMMLSDFTHQFFEGQWKLDDIPEGYYTEKNGIKLMVSGKIHQANEGCACAMGTVMKQFVSSLALEENQIAILDMEAGIEHFGRGLDDEVDVILMVCDPSYESVQLAEKIRELGEKLQKPVYYVLNKTDEISRGVMTQAIRKEFLRFCRQRRSLQRQRCLARSCFWRVARWIRRRRKSAGCRHRFLSGKNIYIFIRIVLLFNKPEQRRSGFCSGL